MDSLIKWRHVGYLTYHGYVAGVRFFTVYQKVVAKGKPDE